jgi:hypothetical protein
MKMLSQDSTGSYFLKVGRVPMEQRIKRIEGDVEVCISHKGVVGGSRARQ